jgi:hypothetical protein
MISLVAGITRASMPHNIDPQNDLRYFSWILFVLVCLIYSAFVFSGELSKDGPLIFSKQNARSLREVLLSHCEFLVILFCVMRIFNSLVLSLPYWITDTWVLGGSRWSVVDVLFTALASIMVYSERKWLFVERRSDNATRPE